MSQVNEGKERLRSTDNEYGAMMGCSIASGNGIGWAVKQMQNGQAVYRRGWNGRGMFLRMQTSDLKMSLPYVCIFTAQGERVPWVCSQTDLLASDWAFFEA